MEIYTCYHCKNTIGSKSNIYMGFDQKFCSNICRDNYTNDIYINIPSDESNYNKIETDQYNIDKKIKSQKSITNLIIINNTNQNYYKKSQPIIYDKIPWNSTNLKNVSKCSYYFYFSLNNICYLLNYIKSY